MASSTGKKRRNPKDPPAEYRFKPGQSGNPGGAPKGPSLLKRIRIAALQSTEKKTIPATKLDVVAMGTIKGAAEGKESCLSRVERAFPDADSPPPGVSPPDILLPTLRTGLVEVLIAAIGRRDYAMVDKILGVRDVTPSRVLSPPEPLDAEEPSEAAPT